MHGADLSDLPANGNQLIEWSLVDQIAGVMLRVPGEIGGQRIGSDRSVLKKFPDLFGVIEGGVGKLPQFGYEIRNGDRFRQGGHDLLRRKSIAQRCRWGQATTRGTCNRRRNKNGNA